MMRGTRALKLKKLRMLLALILFAACGSLVWAAETTITGEINDNYQIVSGNQIYEIADTPAGNELAENHISAKVKVTGSVEERDDMKIITVSSYKVLSE